MKELTELFNAGGIMMYPLSIVAFIALVIIFERIIALRRNKIIVPELKNFLKNLKKESEIEHVEQLCKTYSGPFSNIILLAIENRQMELQDVHQLMEDQGQYEVRDLEKGLSFLETISGLAPLMGLLGTVFGIIKVFDQVKEVGLKDPNAFSGGISEALITTAVGLVIGIIVLLCHNYLNGKADDLIADIENNAVKFIYKLKLMTHDHATT